MERRHEPRFPVSSSIRVIVPGQPPRTMDSQLIDISATGVRFLVSEEVGSEGFVGIEVDSRLILAEIRYTERRGNKFVIGARRLHEVSKDEQLGDAAGAVAEMLGAFHHHITDGGKKDTQEMALEVMERIVAREAEPVPEAVTPVPVEAVEPTAAEPEVVAADIIEAEPVEEVYTHPEPVAAEIIEAEPVEEIYAHPEPVAAEIVEAEPVEEVYAHPEPVAAEIIEAEPVEEVYTHPEPVAAETVPVAAEVIEAEPVEEVYTHPEPVAAVAEPVEAEPLEEIYTHPEPVAAVAEPVEAEPVEETHAHPEPVAAEMEPVEAQIVEADPVEEIYTHLDTHPEPVASDAVPVEAEPVEEIYTYPEPVAAVTEPVEAEPVEEVYTHPEPVAAVAEPVEAETVEETYTHPEPVEALHTPEPEPAETIETHLQPVAAEAEPEQEPEPLHAAFYSEEPELIEAYAAQAEYSEHPGALPLAAETSQEQMQEEPAHAGPVHAELHPLPPRAPAPVIDPLDAARSAAAETLAHMQHNRHIGNKPAASPMVWLAAAAAVVIALVLGGNLLYRNHLVAQAAPVRKTEPAARPAAPVTAAEKTNKLAIRVHAKRGVWVLISVDDQELFSGILSASETRDYSVSDHATLRVAQGADLDLTLNGQNVPIGPGFRRLELSPKGVELASSGDGSRN